MEGAEREPGAEKFWKREAAGVARRVNSGWWLERFNLLLVAGLLLFSVAVLILRTGRVEWIESRQPFLVLGALLLGAALASWWWSRPKFIGTAEGFVRLDDRLQLRSRLVTAAAKVGAWPRRIESVSASPRWRWSMALLPGTLAAVVLVTAWLVPLPQLRSDDPMVVNEPDDWGQMEDWTKTLEEEMLIEPDSLEEIEEKIQELRQQPEEEWFSHASLEATDTLKETLGRDIQELAKDMATLERDLEALRTFSTELTEEGKEMLLREYEEAMKGMNANGLEMNEALAKQLSQIDPSQLGQKTMKQLSPSELDALQKQLGKGAQCLGSMDGLPSMESDPSLSKRPGMQPGSGGIQRGRGDAPLFFGDEDDLGTNQIEAVDNNDLSQAALGDLIGIGETEHDDKNLSSNPKAGGTVSSKAKGGDAVWRDSLVPREKALLKRYFK